MGLAPISVVAPAAGWSPPSKHLRRLGVDHIDLYRVHHPDPGTDIEETLAALGSLLGTL